MVAAIISVSAPSADTYAIGSFLEFVVTFDEDIDVAMADAKLELSIGGRPAFADYTGLDGTTGLNFRYRVTTGDFDDDGIAVVGLTGSITAAADASTADLTLVNVDDTDGVLIDGVRPAVHSILRDGPSATNADTVEFTVTFKEAVSNVSADDFQIVSADGVSGVISVAGSGATYTVTVDDITGQGSLGVGLKSSTDIQDEVGNGGAGAYSSGQTYIIDTTPPAVASVGGPNDKTYVLGDELEFTVTFDGDIVVTGQPQLAITIGSQTVQATLAESASDALTFKYTIAAGQADADGVEVSALTLNGGAISDPAGNAAALTIVNVQPMNGVHVNTDNAVIRSLSGPSAGTYGPYQTLQFQVTFNEAVSVTGTPRIALMVGSNVRAANYSSGSGSSTLTFTYQLSTSDQDPDGIAVGGTVQLNGGAIVSSSGGSATLTLPAFPGQAWVVVDPSYDPSPPYVPPAPPSQPSPSDFLRTFEGREFSPETHAKIAEVLAGLLEKKEESLTFDGVAADVASAISDFSSGKTSEAEFKQELTTAVLPTTGVARGVYTFFTGAPPTDAGMAYLIDSPSNDTDLTDPYYQKFSVENRFINFAVNLGKEGEGRAQFEADYGSLTFAEAVSKAYGSIIGFKEAQRAGFDVESALKYIESKQAYFESLGGDSVGAKAAMIGYVISISYSFTVGVYNEDLQDHVYETLGDVVQTLTAGGGSAPQADWDLL